MRNVLLHLIALLVLPISSTYSCQHLSELRNEYDDGRNKFDFSDVTYTFSQMKIYDPTKVNYSLPHTINKISLIAYDSEKFVYHIDYQYSFRKEPEKKPLRIELPYCIAVNRSESFQFTVTRKNIYKSLTSSVILHPQTPIIETNCCIENFDSLDDKMENPLYAHNHYLNNKNNFRYDISPLRIVFLGKCPTKGYCIYKVHHVEFCHNHKDETLPNPFVFFSPQLIDVSRQIPQLLVSKQSTYLLQLLNSNILFADIKKQRFIRFILREYATNNYNNIDIINPIMSFVSQTCLKCEK